MLNKNLEIDPPAPKNKKLQKYSSQVKIGFAKCNAVIFFHNFLFWHKKTNVSNTLNAQLLDLLVH